MGRQDTRKRHRFKETLSHELQKARGIQSRVAREADVKQSSISYWTNPETTALPTVEQAYDIARALGVSLEYLITGEGAEPPPAEPRLSKQEERLVAAFRRLTPDQRSQIVAMIETFLPREDTGNQEEAG